MTTMEKFKLRNKNNGYWLIDANITRKGDFSTAYIIYNNVYSSKNVILQILSHKVVQHTSNNITLHFTGIS